MPELSVTHIKIMGERGDSKFDFFTGVPGLVPGQIPCQISVLVSVTVLIRGLG